MRRFVLGWKKLGLERSLGTRLVIYADDLVILCRRGNAEAALHHLREIMGKLKLTATRATCTPERDGHPFVLQVGGTDMVWSARYDLLGREDAILDEPADSGDVARSIRDHVARCSDMMSPA
jgi:hypothetical protein